MKRFAILFTISLIVITGCIPPSNCNHGLHNKIQKNPKITERELAEHIKYLASDELGGRYPGTPESKMAQDYIINQYTLVNISPADENGYLQKFDFVNAVETGANNKFSVNDTDYIVSKDFTPLAFSAVGDFFPAECVFVGFGFSIDDSLQWNDYEDVSVKDRWAIMFRGGPDDESQNSKFNPHLPLRKKVLLAQDNGACGVIFVSQYGDDDNELLPLKYDNSFSGAGVPVLNITQSLAEKLFAKSTIDLNTVFEILKSSMQPNSFAIPNVLISANIDLVKTTSEAANIIAIIPGNDPILKNEYIVIGAHYDHLGMGGTGSGSRTPDTFAIHNGADDNASGTAGVLEVGEKLLFMQSKLKRSIILLNFDAEERGLLGSKHFINNSPVNLANVIAMINLDMIGHLEENRLTIGGTGTSPIFKNLLNDINKNYEIDLKLSPEGFGPSDHASFYTKDIPVLFFFTGTHDDYHKPTDDFPIINLAGEKTVSDFVFDIVSSLSDLEERPIFTEAGPKESQAPSRRFKVTFGVIPAHGSQAEGMEIDGVSKDGPADRAGMQKGDIITAIDGKEIKSIYDYMYRLGELKKDSSVPITVLRGEHILELTIEL